MSDLAPIRPTWVEIDLAAAQSNADEVARVAGVPLCAVVKADAYGHGAVPVAAALVATSHVTRVGVALVEEGIELRDAGVTAPILVMGAALGRAHEEIVAYGLVPMVSNVDDLKRFAAVGRARGRDVEVHLKIDTGMARLGLDAAEVPAAVRAAQAAGGVLITGLCSHLACADEDDPAVTDSLTRAQLERFDVAVAAARAAGARPRELHLANSSGALAFAAAGYSFARPGLALYGNGPRPAGVTLRPVMRFRSEIIQLRRVAAGTPVSYGAVWRAPRSSMIAVVPAGYADGYPRRLTGAGEVLIDGHRCPVVGKVCMDMLLADVTGLGDTIGVGAEVVMLGRQGDEAITTAELAARAGITEYEVTCGISKRVPRRYPDPPEPDEPAPRKQPDA